MKALPDLRLWKKYSLVAGVDEAGRGPLAGPVVAAAVILPRNYFHEGIDDSKKLTPERRVRLYEIITQDAVSFAFGIVDADVIDLINILEATKSAMNTALNQLVPPPEFVLIDGLRITPFSFENMAIKKGDTLSLSIAAASILAKVRRDEIMCEYHKSYPQYSFHLHKGYGTRLHIDCIRKYGLSPIHRRSFRPCEEK